MHTRFSHFERSNTLPQQQNAIFLDDITSMRHHAHLHRKAEIAKILREHPWWSELINKVVSSHVKEAMMSDDDRERERIHRERSQSNAGMVGKDGGREGVIVGREAGSVREFEVLLVERIKS